MEMDILHISEQIRHPALIKYIQSRGLEPQHLSGIAKEVHWAKGGRKFFGLGFSNDNGGYSIRSGIFKFNIGPNTVSTIQIGNKPTGIRFLKVDLIWPAIEKLTLPPVTTLLC